MSKKCQNMIARILQLIITEKYVEIGLIFKAKTAKNVNIGFLTYSLVRTYLAYVDFLVILSCNIHIRHISDDYLSGWSTYHIKTVIIFAKKVLISLE